MSGGSQHNPNGRQAQLGAGWSPLQVANFLARAPQAHMGAERGVTWHTPTPPPHLYHVPAPSPPDPLQAMKASGNSVFRHTATPPEIYRHTPTPPDKHLLRHTPSPGDVKATAGLPPSDIYPHLAPARDKVVRADELVGYGRGVDLSVSGRGSNGAGAGVGAGAGAPGPGAAPTPPPALSVRDAPTINSLIARAQPRAGHVRVDTLLERLSVSPASPHSVIVHPPAAAPPAAAPPAHPARALPTPSPPSSNEDSTDSCGAPPGSKRKRKPERTVRVSAPPPPAPASAAGPAPAPSAATPSPSAVHTPSPSAVHAASPSPLAAASPSPALRTDPIENGETTPATNGPDTEPKKQLPPPPEKEPQNEPQSSPRRPTQEEKQSPPQTETCKRKTRANSAETIDDIAAMIASSAPVEEAPAPPEPDAPVSIDKLKSVLASPTKLDKAEPAPEPKKTPPKEDKQEPAAAAPKRRTTRTSNSESTNVPVESPSEAKPAEPEASEAPSAEPTAASFVEVENQLEKMFAGLEDAPKDSTENQEASKPKKRRKSAPTKGETKAGRRANRASTVDGRRKGAKKKNAGKPKKTKEVKDAYDSGSNASSSRSRGPYIQIRGPSDSPLSVSVMNAATGEEEGESTTRRKTGDEFRNGLRAKGLHASTLGLRYDATTPDATWLCAFCLSGPHKHGLGDLFGPYQLSTDCEEYRALEPAARARYECGVGGGGAHEVWFHELCAVWAPGVVAAGARLWGLARAVWSARALACHQCGRHGAALACSDRRCRARAHVPCALAARWLLDEDTFRPWCPAHRPHQA